MARKFEDLKKDVQFTNMALAAIRAIHNQYPNASLGRKFLSQRKITAKLYEKFKTYIPEEYKGEAEADLHLYFETKFKQRKYNMNTIERRKKRKQALPNDDVVMVAVSETVANSSAFRTIMEMEEHEAIKIMEFGLSKYTDFIRQFKILKNE